MHILAEIVNAECVRRIAAHRKRATNFPTPAAQIFRPRLGRLVAPRVEAAFAAAARGVLPLGFRGQAITPPAHRAQPLAILRGLRPAHRHHRLVRLIQVRIIPAGRRRVTRGLQEESEIAVPHLIDRHLESIHPHTVDRPLRLLAVLRTHQERTCGDQLARRVPRVIGEWLNRIVRREGLSQASVFLPQFEVSKRRRIL